MKDVIGLNRKNEFLEAKLNDLQISVDDLTKENKMLREYYKTDEEPSDEIKARILINIELNNEIKHLREINSMQSRLYMTSAIISSQNVLPDYKIYNYPVLH